MPAGHLAHHFRRRLIVDAFVGDIPRRRLRGALDNDTFDALVEGAARIVLVHFLAPHAGQLGLRGQGIHGGGSATLLGHGLDASSLGFGNQALNCYLLVRGRCGSCLLMNGKLLLLQFSYSCAVYVSTRDAEEELGQYSTRRNVMRWFRELQHYGFIVMVSPAHHGVRPLSRLIAHPNSELRCCLKLVRFPRERHVIASTVAVARFFAVFV